ncbi:uncharacterized protein K02A2.6-like isoform X3 [Drosophila simulans]|nr:uncharacterized protein K02A2.6-like isoform X3 [Drosophila simulans]XP_039150809.1 uncharacterized protein K02A2.6-like isoform X3 [Drosophila simulans]XP_039154449.1 uncharacterized protein K02A2.6-like isoform X3 [Drosophila simulans]XP_039154450.1 uncharacterized protein K02A2.6-like isoform X3 [Drosophila simulans]
MQRCAFGSSKAEIEDICLKDKIIDVWAPLDLKKRLLGKENSLEEVIEVCQVEEQINKESKEMTSRPSAEPICKIAHRGFKQSGECPRCGKFGHTHNDPSCPARNVTCNKCSKPGHYARKCRTNLNSRFPKSQRNNLKRPRTYIRSVEEEATSSKLKKGEAHCFRVSSEDEEEFIRCRVGGREIPLIIDSGCKFNLISHADWSLLVKRKATVFNVRTHTEKQFRAYASNKLLRVMCIFEAPISVEPGAEGIASFYVIENGEQSLLGRDTAIELKVLRLGRNINRIEEIEPFPSWKNIEVRLSIDYDVKPVQQPVRRIPAALEDKVMEKLGEALSRDIIEPVKGPSAWISPIVLAFKENGDIRLCVDMRLANKAILRENYPLPTFDCFMTRLKEAKFFARLDLKDAYHQVALDESSREITTFITPRGLFRYKRLMFGVNSAPEIFQRLLEQMLSTVPNAMNFIDDIIIFGATDLEIDSAVKEVCEIFQENNVLLNKEKCIWKTRKLKFLGHILSDKGIEVDPEKIDVIRSFRDPKNKEETRSFLGLVTYVGKFIPDLASHTDPLRKLLKTENKFTWGEAEKNAFNNLKNLLSKVPKLSYFDPKHRTRVIADASPVALGAVLLQFKVDNEPLIITFASKALSEVEKRYSQTEKESLALVWAVEKFYYFLAGLHFELVTDHKPLEAIFKPTSKPPARIERWLLRLQAYTFTVIYKSGKDNISDALSRLCQLSTVEPIDLRTEYSILRVVQSSIPKSMTISEIAESSKRDEEIMDAIGCLENDSWKPDSSGSFYPFRNELSAVGSLLLRGNRVVVPRSLRMKILELAHEGHPGETAMKRRLRSKVWWPQIDREAEKFVKACRDCCLVSQDIRPPPMDRNPFPTGPWIWVASDLLGPLPNNEYVLVFIDYFSRYMEHKFLKTISSTTLIEAMKEIFCRLGYPEYLRTDNGRQYVSEEFSNYCKACGIEQVRTPPYWPQANGEVENMNRALVKRLKIAYANGKNYKEEIQKFILMYNVTPHGTTGSAPTKLMFSRVIRDKIPGVGDIYEKTLDSEERDKDIIGKYKGKQAADKRRGAKEVDIEVGDKVLLKNVVFPNKLTSNFDKTEFTVLERHNNIVVIEGGGRKLTRNASHLKKVPASQTYPASCPTPQSDASLPESTPTSEVAVLQPTEGGLGIQPPLPPLKLKLVNKGGMWQPALPTTKHRESSDGTGANDRPAEE